MIGRLSAIAIALTPLAARAQLYGTQGMDFAAVAIATYRDHAGACGFAAVVGEAVAATDRFWEQQEGQRWLHAKAESEATSAFVGNAAGLLADGTVKPCAARAEIVRMGVLPVLLFAAPDLLGAMTKLDKNLR